MIVQNEHLLGLEIHILGFLEGKLEIRGGDEGGWGRRLLDGDQEADLREEDHLKLAQLRNPLGDCDSNSGKEVIELVKSVRARSEAVVREG